MIEAATAEAYLWLNERSSLNLTFTGICWLTLEFEGQGSKDIISGEVSLDSSSLACMPDLTVELEYRNGNVRFRDGDGRFVSYSPSNSGNTIEMPSVIHTRH